VISSTFSGLSLALDGCSVRGRFPLSVGKWPVVGCWATNPFNNGLPPGEAIDSMISTSNKQSRTTKQKCSRSNKNHLPTTEPARSSAE